MAENSNFLVWFLVGPSSSPPFSGSPGDNTQLKLTGVTANEEYGLTQLETAREISGWIGSTDYELAQERGVYYLAWDNDLASANHTGDGVLCTMTFEIIGTFAADDTTVITPVKEGENVLPIANVMNFAMDDLQNDVEFVAGTLSFVEYTWLLGDMNGDNRVNKNDAVALIRYCAMPNRFPLDYPYNLDLNGDGAINKNDAVALIRYSAMPDRFPIKY